MHDKSICKSAGVHDLTSRACGWDRSRRPWGWACRMFQTTGNEVKYREWLGGPRGIKESPKPCMRPQTLENGHTETRTQTHIRCGCILLGSWIHEHHRKHEKKINHKQWSEKKPFKTPKETSREGFPKKIVFIGRKTKHFQNRNKNCSDFLVIFGHKHWGEEEILLKMELILCDCKVISKKKLYCIL